jgi:hypothetical protein
MDGMKFVLASKLFREIQAVRNPWIKPSLLSPLYQHG